MPFSFCVATNMSDNLTPFMRYWRDLNRNLASVKEPEAHYGEAHDMFRSRYTAVNAAAFIKYNRHSAA